MLDSTSTATLSWGEISARRFLLLLFFAMLSFPVALQQTTLGLLLVLFAIQRWRQRALPTTILDRSLLVLFGAFLLSTLMSPDIGNSLLSYRKIWAVKDPGAALFAHPGGSVKPRGCCSQQEIVSLVFRCGG